MKTNVVLHFLTILLLLSFLCSVAGARESYKDVAVIINTNSTTSQDVGAYFAAQRMIPAQNIIRISVPEVEEITDAQFQDLRNQVEAYLTAHDLTDSINYIVTTKGMPLKVNRGNVSSLSSSSASVESELCLILGPYASQIGGAGSLYSPYFLMQQNFTRRQFGIYLVTRLDGYTYADVKAMIDHATEADSTVLTSGKFVFDMDPTSPTSPGTLNGNMAAAATALQSRNRLTLLDQTTQYLTNVSNVLGYVSWGSNDANAATYTLHADPHHQFLPGSIAETYVSTSARSFTSGTTYGQSLIADLIAEGVTGVKGYVYEPYSNAMAMVQYTFPMYTDGYTLAECFYSGSPYLSWMDVVVGDPKMRIRTVRVPPTDLILDGASGGSALPVELTSFSGRQSEGMAVLSWETATEVNNFGFDVEKQMAGSWQKAGFVEGAGTSNAVHRYAFTDLNAAPGVNAYRLKQIDRDGNFSYSKTVEVAVAMSVKEFRLKPNYPNPFNPSTVISFTVAKTGHAELKVYNAIGQEIAVLFSGNADAGVIQNVTFNAAARASGVYFSVLTSEGSRMVQQMMLLK